MSGWLLIFWLGLDPFGAAPPGMEHILIGMYSDKTQCDTVRSGYVAGWNSNGVHGPAPTAMSDCIPALVGPNGSIPAVKTWVRR